MGKTQDRALVFGAAESWLNELNEYIVPGVLTKEERKSYRRQADKLQNALARERERARKKQEARRIPTGELVHFQADGGRAACGATLTKWVSPLPTLILSRVNCLDCRAVMRNVDR